LCRGRSSETCAGRTKFNRTPPKTQSALLEAMQELSLHGPRQSIQIAVALFVLATQNPIELEGTYALPEAQLDRFCSTPCLII